MKIALIKEVVFVVQITNVHKGLEISITLIVVLAIIIAAVIVVLFMGLSGYLDKLISFMPVIKLP